jgi:hypothetical protein
MADIPPFHETYTAAAIKQLEALAGRPLTEAEHERLRTVAREREKAGDQVIAISNTYSNVRTPIKLSTAASWAKHRPRGMPTVTGHGTLFMNHEEYPSVVGAFVQYLLDTRKVEKNAMFDLIRLGRALDDPEVKAKDQAQKIFKLLANSWYGAMGEKGFHFFSEETPPAVTYSGQLCTAATLWTFEGFLSNNLALQDADEMAHHIAECALHCQGASLAEWELEAASDEQLVEQLVESSSKLFKDARLTAERLVAGLSQGAKTAISYQGQPFRFMESARAMGLLDVVLNGTIQEADGKSIGKHHPEGKAALEELWTGLQQWVSVPWLAGDLPRRALSMRRRVVTLADTDSTFLYLGRWMKWLGQSYDLSAATPEERLTALNAMVYLLRLLNDDVMWRLTGNLQIPENKRRILNFKSEFVISRMMLTGGKKHYVGLLQFQEGAQLPGGGKVEIKGLALKKTNTARSTGKFYEKSIEKGILRSPAVDRSGLVRDVVELEQRVRSSILSGSTEYSNPSSVGRINTYANPWGMPSIRGMSAWNAAMPDMPIREGDKVNLFACRVNTDATVLTDEMEKWPEGSPEHTALLAITETFFGDGAKTELTTNGLNWLSAPKEMTQLPAWALGLLDPDAAAQANTAPILPVLEAVGVKLLRLPSPESYSNVLAL